MLSAIRRMQAPAGARAAPGVVIDVFIENEPEMMFAGDQDPVQAVMRFVRGAVVQARP
jgi:hypothetical protein